MSRRQLHDLLTELKSQRDALDPVYHEQHRRIDELISSLERQRVDDFASGTAGSGDAEANEAISNRITELVAEYEAEHPKIAALLNGIGQMLQNFRV